jgi:hypothetical protein
MPPRLVLVGLLALTSLPPFFAQATGTVVGSYTMFNRIERYHLELAALTQVRNQRVSVRSLAAHLSPEARVILLPADGFAVGADQVDLTIAGLPDLARLVCALRPEATAARAALVRGRFEGRASERSEARVECRGMP